MKNFATVGVRESIAVLERQGEGFNRRKADRERHLVAAYTNRRIGPTLIVVGGIHGNEPSGVEAMRLVKPHLDELAEKLRGRVYFVAGNTRALGKRVRYV